ncbi:MAG: type IV pili twitching motility protein PilT [Alphaproteobacteria bacterium]|nr:MAG: type IV pili twitching motility protein PilT [Alphaproteobacteria bacterium]
MNKHEASDMYLTVGFPPTLRGDEGLIKLTDEMLSPDDINEILASMLTSRQRRDFDVQMELNTALDMGEHGRFRINVLRQRQFPALVIRRIVSEIPSFSALRLPKILEHMVMEKRGLILVTGMTGSGKSTTLAAMIDHRNRSSAGHIITIEDPIEFFHEHKGCVVTQREIGVDTESFATAMKNSLRQRPDVILVGEIRDREVMEQALAIAETGHLCLATIHTNNSYQAIERIVNLFPEDAHNQIRLNLSMNLKGIISQRLLPSVGGGLAPAIEVLINQGLVRELILKGEIGKIHDVMEQNNSIGMSTFDQSLMLLFMDDLITEDTAITNSDKPSDMKIKVQQAKMVQSSHGATSRDALGGVDTSRISFSE